MPYAPDELAGFSMTLLRMLAFAPGTAAGVAKNVPVAPSAAARAAPDSVAKNPSAPAAASPAQSDATRADPVQPAPPEPLAARYAEPATPPTPGVAESAPMGAWDWLDIVSKLKLGGMAKMLADHCELVAHDGDAVLLRVGEAHKHLLDRTYQDKLVATLREHHGAGLQVKFEIGAAATQTPQQVRTRARDARQAEAVVAIESDPFVRELVAAFDATVVESTIQPVND
jgi:DNA polymerase-3 subunit gamma/tau